MEKLALNIIAYDQVKEIENIIKSYEKYFDEICIAVDKDFDKFEPLCSDKVKIFKYEWNEEEIENGFPDFARKRNFIAEKTQSPYYLRIDTDDIIANHEKIRESFSLMVRDEMDVLYVPYYYSFENDGQCNAKHWRETIIKKRPDIYWNKPIHENIFVVDPSCYKGMQDDSFSIIHKIDEDHAEKSHKRNLKILLKEFHRDKEKTDPRTIAYLGRIFLGMREYKTAIKFLEILIKKSGWDDDKYYAWIHMGECYHMLGDANMAFSCFNEALAINTKFPDAYLAKGALYLEQGDYDKSIDWLMPGIVRKEPQTHFVVDPSIYTYKCRLNASAAFLGKGDVEMAIKYFNEAKNIAPNNNMVKSFEKIITDAYEADKYFKNFSWNLEYTLKEDKAKVKLLIDSIPKKMLTDERIMFFKNKYVDPKQWGDDEIVFYCGQAWEQWGPSSIHTGIGGSEEAVIYLSKELLKLGFKVTVYNSCLGMEGDYDGVEYKNYFEFNVNDNFSNLIAWRNNIFTSGKIKAKNKIIWLHDVPQDGQFPKDTIDSFDKIIVLSEFHKKLLPHYIPDDKILVSANGVNIEDFDGIGLRNNKRLIYTSSYDRGIQHLLQIFPEIREEVPDVELHIYYGWNTWIEMEKKGVRPKDFRIAMQSLMQQPGVFEHGRIGHKDLAKQLKCSGIYVYPSHFEEISCISAMKAQVAGCVALTTDYAALNETNKFGIKIQGNAKEKQVMDEFKKKLIELLKSPNEILKISALAIENKDVFSWGNVAKQWSSELFRKV